MTEWCVNPCGRVYTNCCKLKRFRSLTLMVMIMIMMMMMMMMMMMNKSSTQALWHWPLKVLPPLQETKPNPHRSRESVQWPQQNFILQSILHHPWPKSPKGRPHLFSTKELPKKRHCSTHPKDRISRKGFKAKMGDHERKVSITPQQKNGETVAVVWWCEQGVGLFGGLVERTMKNRVCSYSRPSREWMGRPFMR